MKDIEPVVMPDDIMCHFVLDATGDVDFRHHHTLAPHQRIAEQFSVWADNHRDRSRACAQQLFHTGIALRKLLDGIGIERARRDNVENLALEGMGRRANADRLTQIVVLCATPRPVERPRRGIRAIRQYATSSALVTTTLFTCSTVNRTPGRMAVTALSVNQAPLMTRNTCDRQRKLFPRNNSFSGDFVFSAFAQTLDSGTFLM